MMRTSTTGLLKTLHLEFKAIECLSLPLLILNTHGVRLCKQWTCMAGPA